MWLRFQAWGCSWQGLAASGTVALVIAGDDVFVLASMRDAAWSREAPNHAEPNLCRPRPDPGNVMSVRLSKPWMTAPLSGPPSVVCCDLGRILSVGISSNFPAHPIQFTPESSLCFGTTLDLGAQRSLRVEQIYPRQHILLSMLSPAFYNYCVKGHRPSSIRCSSACMNRWNELSRTRAEA